MDELTVRSAEVEDLPTIVEIYNHYVVTTPITFDVSPFTLEGRKPWFEQFAKTGPHRLLVLELAGAVTGYASSTRHRAKAAYDRSVETTIYLDPGHVGRGRGRSLYGALLGLLESEPQVHRAFAGITLPNTSSVGLHQRCGFEPIGVFGEIGFKFDRYWDVAWYERDVSGGAA